MMPLRVALGLVTDHVTVESARGPGYELVIVNPGDRSWTKHRYVLAFGAYGWTKLMAYANSLGDALDECVDWIAEHAPGLLADDAVEEAYREALEGGEAPCSECDGDGGCSSEGAGMCEACGGSGVRRMTEEEAREEAEVDTTCAGNSGHYLLSWEWTIVAEDPSRAEMMDILGRK